MNEIGGKLSGYVYQLRNLLQKLENLKGYSEPGEELSEKLVIEGTKFLVEELLESPSAGRFGKQLIDKEIKSQKKRRQKQVLLQQEDYFCSLLYDIKEFLKNISVKKSNLPPNGNSIFLLKKFASIEGYSKLETKIRKTIVILTQIREEDLIYNSKILQHLEEQKSRKREVHYAILTKLEQTFRAFIIRDLEEVSKDWWTERVPVAVHKMAEQRKKRSESPWNRVTGENLPIDYVDFADYAKIITREDNWNNIFRDVFHNKEAILSKLKELEPIRNAVMHSRNLDSKQIQRLQLYSNDLNNAMKKS